MSHDHSNHPKAIGDRAEAHVLAALVECYPTVLLPWGENQRYDFVVDDPVNGFLRIQAKSGRLSRGAVHFNAFSTSYHHPSNRGTRHFVHDYVGDADAFGVWCRQTREVFLVPVQEVGHTEVTLRVDLPKNNQRARIRFASDYKIHPPE